MKAIIKVSNFSAFAKYNGLTFKVTEMLNGLVVVDINGQTTDFSYKEVIIVDIRTEWMTAKSNTSNEARYSKKKINDAMLVTKLEEYCKWNKINLEY